MEKTNMEQGKDTLASDKSITTGQDKTKPPFFLPSLLRKQVKITPLGGLQPVTGELIGFNNYELRLNVRGRELIVFKHAVYFLEVVKG